MKIAIAGFGLEGQSSLTYFTSRGHSVTVLDENSKLELPAGVEAILGKNAFSGLDKFDLIVRSAGLNPHKLLDSNPDVANKITTQLNEFMRVCPSQNVIGITGTKGKGTTCSLVAKMLEASGKKVVLAGNIGVPMLSLLDGIDADTFVVLELSSFQLIDFKASSPHLAACLMVVSEHLNWHDNLDDYITSKKQLFRHQKPEDTAIYYSGSKLSEEIVSSSPGHKLPYYEVPGAYVDNGVITIDNQAILKVSELKLLGQHNWQNVCAAVTITWQVTQDLPATRKVLTSFSGLEHRLEFVREVNGAKYYNDSFGTTPETAVVALQTITGPKVLITGGSDKGSDYTAMAQATIDNDVKHTICIGITGQKIANLIKSLNPEADITVYGPDDTPTMAEIVELAQSLAQPGDSVLLSTGSASFGLFKNYKDRGVLFKSAVSRL